MGRRNRSGLFAACSLFLLLVVGCTGAPAARPAPPRPDVIPPVAAPPLSVIAAGEAPDVESTIPLDVKRFEDLEHRGKIAELAVLLDRLLADPAGSRKLVHAAGEEDPCWTSARELLRRRLLALPAAGKDELVRVRGHEAAEGFEAAWRARSSDALAALAERYPTLPGAARALRRAGELYFEEGESAAARRAWERALDLAGSDAERKELAALAARARVAPVVSAARLEAPLTLLYRHELAPARGAGGRACATAIDAELGEFFVANEAASVSAIAIDTGQLLWRTPVPAGPAGPVTVSGRHVVLVRESRRVLVLERETGRVELALDATRELRGAARDTIDAAAWRDGQVTVVARLDGVRVVLAFDLQGVLLYRTPLWTAKGGLAALLCERDGVRVAADASLASLARDGGVRWVRGLAAAASPETGDLEASLIRVGEELVFTGPLGVAVVDAVTGLARTSHAVSEHAVAVATAGTEPLIVEVDRPPPPPGGVMVRNADEDDEDGEGVPARRAYPFRLSAAQGDALRRVGVIPPAGVSVKPLHAGAVQGGRLVLLGDGQLRLIELAPWRVVSSVACPGTGRVHVAGSRILAVTERCVEGYGPRTSTAPPRAVKDAAPPLTARSSAAEREAVSPDVGAATPGTGVTRVERFAVLTELAGASDSLASLAKTVREEPKSGRAAKLLRSDDALVSELQDLILGGAPRPVREAAAELLVAAGGAEEDCPARPILVRALKDEQVAVRAPVFRALFACGGYEGRDLAVHSLPDERARREQMRRAADVLRLHAKREEPAEER